MTERLAVAFTGYSGVGKTSIARHLVSEREFMGIEGSALIRDVTPHPLARREDYEQAFRELQGERGGAWISDYLFALDSQRLAFSGLRTLHDLGRFRAHKGIIIALVSPPEICLDRLDKTDSKNPHTLEEYGAHLLIENHPSPDGYGSNTAFCIANADHTVDTSGTLEDSINTVEMLLGLSS